MTAQMDFPLGKGLINRALFPPHPEEFGVARDTDRRGLIGCAGWKLRSRSATFFLFSAQTVVSSYTLDHVSHHL
jgi:hypothetical protein